MNNPFLNGIISAIRPRENIPIGTWSEKHIVLPSAASARPGPIILNKYQKGILDTLADEKVRKVIIMSSAQVGKTLLQQCAVAYYIAQEPSACLFVMPRDADCAAFVDERLEPVLAACDPVAAVLPNRELGNYKNKREAKIFPGGFLAIVGSGSPSGLASRPCKVIFMDEVDRFATLSEGDAFSLASKRTQTYIDRKIFAASTPTFTGRSTIEREYNDSNKCRWFSRCPHCDHKQTLTMEHIRWNSGNPESAKIHCEHCGVGWSENERKKAIATGEWISTLEDGKTSKTVGFHINQISSPYSTLSEIVEAYEKSKNDMRQLQTFYNTFLGESFDENKFVEIKGETLNSAIYDFSIDPLPDEILLLTAAADVQGQRIEAAVYGWDRYDRAYLLDHEVIIGNPETAVPWLGLRQFFSKTYKHELAGELRIERCCVDSGYLQETVISHVKKFQQQLPVIAIKGVAKGTEVLKDPNQKFKRGNAQYTIGTNIVKDKVFAMLMNEDKNSNCVLLRRGKYLDDAYLDQLVSEQKRVTYSKAGYPAEEWYKPQGRSNEAFDLLVYNYAMKHSLKYIDIEKRYQDGILNRNNIISGKPKEPEKDVFEKLGSIFGNN